MITKMLSKVLNSAPNSELIQMILEERWKKQNTGTSVKKEKRTGTESEQMEAAQSD